MTQALMLPDIAGKGDIFDTLASGQAPSARRDVFDDLAAPKSPDDKLTQLRDSYFQANAKGQYDSQGTDTSIGGMMAAGYTIPEVDPHNEIPIEQMTPQQKAQSVVALTRIMTSYDNARTAHAMQTGTHYAPADQILAQQAAQVQAGRGMAGTALDTFQRAGMQTTQALTEGPGAAASSALQGQANKAYPITAAVAGMGGKMLAPEMLPFLVAGGPAGEAALAEAGGLGRAIVGSMAGAAQSAPMDVQQASEGGAVNPVRNLIMMGAGGLAGEGAGQGVDAVASQMAPAARAATRLVGGTAAAGATNLGIGEAQAALDGQQRTTQQRIADFLSGAVPHIAFAGPGALSETIGIRDRLTAADPNNSAIPKLDAEIARHVTEQPNGSDKAPPPVPGGNDANRVPQAVAPDEPSEFGGYPEQQPVGKEGVAEIDRARQQDAVKPVSPTELAGMKDDQIMTAAHDRGLPAENIAQATRMLQDHFADAHVDAMSEKDLYGTVKEAFIGNVPKAEWRDAVKWLARGITDGTIPQNEDGSIAVPQRWSDVKAGKPPRTAPETIPERMRANQRERKEQAAAAPQETVTERLRRLDRERLNGNEAISDGESQNSPVPPSEPSNATPAVTAGAAEGKPATIPERLRALDRARKAAQAPKSGTIQSNPTEESANGNGPGRATLGEVDQGPAGRSGTFEGNAVPGHAGRRTIIRLADKSQHPATYRAVEAEDLIPSHDARRNFSKNPTGDVNERPYEHPDQGRSSRQTVEDIARNPDPALLTTDSPTPTDGPPITAPTGQVLSGNARSMAVQLAYSRGGKPADVIRKGMIDAAEKLGIDPAGVKDLKNPVIVREIDDPRAPGQLSRLMNESLTTGKAAATDAASRAARVSPRTAEVISTMLADDRSIREVLADPKAVNDLAGRFVKDGVWSHADLEKFLDPSTGAMTEDGKIIVERTLLGRVIDEPAILSSMQPQVRNLLMAGLGDITQMAADPTTDIRPQLKNAVEAFNAWKRSGMSLSDYFFDQASLMPPPGYGDLQTALLVHGLDTMGPRQFKNAIGLFRELWQPESGGLLGNPHPVERTRAMWEAFGKDMKGPGVVREAKALGLPVKDEPAGPSSLFPGRPRGEEPPPGPGAAATNDPNFRKENPGTLPPPPETGRTASVATAHTEPPAGRWIERITTAARSGLDSARRYAGHFLPTTSRLNPEAAAAAAEFMSAPEIAEAHTAIAIRRTLGEQPTGSTLDRLVNSVILEDGLRGDRAKFQRLAEEARRQAAAQNVLPGKVGQAASNAQTHAELLKQADAYDRDARAVKTIIGDAAHELPTEKAYEQAKQNPEVQRALAAHRSYAMGESENYYRLEAHIAYTTDVPIRGADTNTYLTRKAVARADADVNYAPANRPGTRELKSGLNKTAFGNATQYANTYSENVAHQFDRQTRPGLQAKYFKALIDGGDAVMGEPGTAPRDPRNGEFWKGHEVKVATNIFSEDGEVQFIKPRTEYIYVRPELDKEFQRVMGTANTIQRGGVSRGFSDLMTAGAIMSTAEPSAHLVNHVAQLYKILVYPGRNQGILARIGVGEFNAANVPLIGKTLSIIERIGPKLVQMVMERPEIAEQSLEAARAAGLQPENQVRQSAVGRAVGGLIGHPNLAENALFLRFDPFAYVSRAIGAFTKASRLVGLDAFHAMADAGVAEDTPLNKTRFLSQFTQYHHEAQSQLVTLARKTGLGPFASAGQNFLMQRFRGIVGSPNFTATTNAQAIRARVTTAAAAWSGLAVAGLANYVLWGAFKPKGTPAGALVYGKDDEGRFKYLPVGQWIGMRPAGVAQFTDAYLDNATLTQAIDKGAKGLAQGIFSPYIGPAGKGLYVAATGREPFSDYDAAGRAPAGESQTLRNMKAAALQFNPTVANLADDRPGGAEKLLGAFAPRVGRNPDNVPDSRAGALANELITARTGTFRTPPQAAKATLKATIVRLYKSGQKAQAEQMLVDAGKSGQLQHTDLPDLRDRIQLSHLAYTFKQLPVDDAMQVFRSMTPAERQASAKEMHDKIINAKITPSKRIELGQKFKSMLSD